PPPATYTLSLHDALPIFDLQRQPLLLIAQLAQLAAQAQDFALKRFTLRPLALELLDGAIDFVLKVRELFQSVYSAHSAPNPGVEDRKSTRLNSSHDQISY